MMELLIGEGKEKFDKLGIDGDFDELSQRLDLIHYQNLKDRVFIFRRNKETELCELYEKNEMIDFKTNIKSEFLMYQNPSIIVLDSGQNVPNKTNCIEIFIGVNDGGGLKFTVYNTQDLDMKNLMKTLNSIDGIGSVTICNSLTLWVNGRIRTLKMSHKDLSIPKITI